MVRPAEMGSGTPLISVLEPLWEEIADLLGQLAGNEAAWRVLDAEQNRTLNDGWALEPGYFSIPGDYGFDTPALFVAMHPMHPDFNSSPVNNAQREQLLQDAIDQVWHQARDQWSNGAVGTVYRSITRNVWEPDPGAALSAAQSFYDVSAWLQEEQGGAGWVPGGESGAPRWLTDLAVHWPATAEGSLSAQSFQAFWDDVNDKLSHYLHATARLAATSTQVAVTLADFQTNLRDITERARDRVREALEQWQAWKDDSGAWPTGTMSDNGLQTILGGASYATGVGSLATFKVPPLSLALGVFSGVTGGLAYIVPDQVVDMEATQAATATEIHDGLSNDLHTCVDNMTAALDGVRTNPLDDQSDSDLDTSTSGSQAFNAYVSEVVANHHDWSPEPVNL